MMCKFIIGLALALGVTSPAIAETPSTVYFSGSVENTVQLIENGCMSLNFQVADVGPNYVVCSERAKGGILTDLLVGGSYTYSTTSNMRLQVIPFGNGSAVQYSEWLESSTAFGVRRMPRNSDRVKRGDVEFLTSLGGSVSAPGFTN